MARLRQAIDQAQGAAERKLWPAAITYQQDAVIQARTLAAPTNDRQALVQLSVLLYNLAGYCQQANHHTEAVACYAEVVALDEQTGHADLEADRQALAQARQWATAHAAGSLPPQPTTGSALGSAANLTALLAQLSPAERAALAHFAALPPEEQAARVNRTPLQQAEESLFPQVAALLAAHQAGELDPAHQAASIQSLDALLPQLAQDPSLGAGRHALVALLGCVVAYLRGAALPPVPAGYAAVWTEWMER